VRRVPAPAKLNLALVVGPRRADGKHEVTTVLQRLDLGDRVSLAPADGLRVQGFRGDTLVREALSRLAGEAGVKPRWHVRIEKRIPVASGLGGGSSDAAAALRLANAALPQPLPPDRLRDIAAGIGSDVPFFLAPGAQLGEEDGTALSPLQLPQDFWVVLLLPSGTAKAATATVYEEFDRGDGANGYEERRAQLLAELAAVRRPRDLARLPPNDLASSPAADGLRAAGAFRADVTGAGPAVFGLFHHRRQAAAARRGLRGLGRTWLTVPAWYG
jgi:4-diphosphocytidyl-2-C-methyl-D-erythritol kinase